MGLRNARQRFVRALESGDFTHEDRDDREAKNWLATGKVSVEQVVTMLHRCRGKQYRTSPHHFDTSLTMHEFKPRFEGRSWYIKGYFSPEGLNIYSVHPSGGEE